MDADTQALESLRAAMRASFDAEGLAPAEVRKARLGAVIELLLEHKDAFTAAIDADFGGRSRHHTGMELYATLESLKFARANVARWMRPERRSAPLPMRLVGTRARVEYQSKGVVGILGTWNFPLNTVLSPLASALAAGNRAMLRVSESVPRTSELLAEQVRKRFPADVLTVVEGPLEVSVALAGLPLDHLVFTGSTHVGKLVMAAAAKHLVPVTLELGGKSPVILAEDADLDDAAYKIVLGKSLNAGQACLAPDYVLVPERLRDRFVEVAQRVARAMHPTFLDNPDATVVATPRHHARLLGLLDDARQSGLRIVDTRPEGESDESLRARRKLPLCFVLDADRSHAVMQEEIFGPILPVRTYRTLDDALAYVRAGERPLALYVFTRSSATVARALETTRSGGVTVNDVLFHGSIDDLPFGGIGASGLGHYRGRDGFRALSHARAVCEQSRIHVQKLSGMVPPFGDAADKNLTYMLR